MAVRRGSSLPVSRQKNDGPRCHQVHAVGSKECYKVQLRARQRRAMVWVLL